MAQAAAVHRLRATYSYAGRVETPRPQPIARRIGGFGGVDGLKAYLRENRITHVIDATHPFSERMSRNAVTACRDLHIRLVALTRPAWQERPGDDWQRVPDFDAAVEALAGPPRRVMLAVGRMHLPDFARQPQHQYLLRLVDAPTEPPPLPKHAVVVARGPFREAGDRALMREHGIELVVSKNAGGDGARAKLDAARALGIPVLMIDRPRLPRRKEVSTPEEVLDWMGHVATERGV